MCEQAEYHLFQREKVEVQLPELYHKIGRCQSIIIFSLNPDRHAGQLILILCVTVGVGAMTWSPLACGIISGKYENGIPESSRASMKVPNLL